MNTKDKLKKMYEATFKGKQEGEQHLFNFDAAIYFDGRQYSCKIPKGFFDLMGFKKGDKLRFTIDDTDSSLTDIKYIGGKK